MLYIMDACTVAPLFRGADGPNCKDIINGIAFQCFPAYVMDTAIILVFLSRQIPISWTVYPVMALIHYGLLNVT